MCHNGKESKMDREQAKVAKCRRSRFYRRKKGILKKVFELHNLCQADVALCIRKSGRTYIFSSTKTVSPFSKEILV